MPSSSAPSTPRRRRSAPIGPRARSSPPMPEAEASCDAAYADSAAELPAPLLPLACSNGTCRTPMAWEHARTSSSRLAWCTCSAVIIEQLITYTSSAERLQLRGLLAPAATSGVLRGRRARRPSLATLSPSPLLLASTRLEGRMGRRREEVMLSEALTTGALIGREPPRGGLRACFDAAVVTMRTGRVGGDVPFAICVALSAKKPAARHSSE